MYSVTFRFCLFALLLSGLFSPCFLFAQTKGITNTSNSKFSKLQSIDLNAVRWNNGFWAEKMKLCNDSMVPHLWETYTNKKISHSFANFEIAAGLDTGSFKGPSFHDGDFYKTLEAVAALYATTKYPKLDSMMDDAIAVIAKAQKQDGYIYTKAIIQQNKTGNHKMFDDKLSFEAYNFGHLMTAACVHYRATGKVSLLKIAEKATDFLITFYNTASPEQARNAICPSHYMGIVEMYRTTGNKQYLELVKKLIDIRGLSDGSDDNSDRVPFRQMKTVNGHAVRANYLFAGVADVFAETGDSSLLSTLLLMWNDVVYRKMYITGGCGALYDGLSQEGLSYKPDSIQKIQQAYGKDYQLPNKTAHNETCANIGNLLWNWRMLQITGDASYADIIELELYNGILSGISLNGNNFFYTNPLAASFEYPYDLRWSGGRVPYIRLSNCCPPNTVRTLAEVSSYAYSLINSGLYVNLYGANTLTTQLLNGSTLQLTQQTNYPWDGAINFTIDAIQSQEYSFFFRIPAWCHTATLFINGKATNKKLLPGTYVELKRQWKVGDKIQLNLPMAVQLMVSNPLVEETRNQVAVKRGPIVYCAESLDLPKGKHINEISIPSQAKWSTELVSIDNSKLLSLKGVVNWVNIENWHNKLYAPMDGSNKQQGILSLIPYYSWANRGQSEMTVWMPLSK